MKKIVLGLIATMVALLVATTSVNAAEIKVDSNSAAEDGKVKVTLNLNEASDGVQFDLKYDGTIFEYESVSATGGVTADANVVKEGKEAVLKVITFSMSDATSDTITVTFNVKEGTAGEAGAFEVEGLAGTTETVTEATTPDVEIVEKQPTTDDPTNPDNPTNPDDPTNPDQPSQDNPAEPSNPSQDDPTPSNPSQNQPSQDEPKAENPTDNKDNTNNAELKDENGKPIKEIPPTGAPVYAGIIAVGIVAGVALVVRKIRK